ncbi:SpoVR family protein [Sulfobacillus harzensis]|uniref:SpoVR family protein n=1 Tax=Sulfobacillus harzensis TaxID=2729629 RepID=A0A7Y0Q4M6_9FIRM|nr:SpoVR family protein [Sulfobacillus harzensis]NMP24575.1 SpoVR family protein [Sulfobacillus harzensis]
MLDEGTINRLLERVWPVAEQLGLNPGHVHFELVSPQTIQVLASHGGLPVRYSHWSFGKSEQRLKTAFDFRLTQIYELVINNIPAYAFIDETVGEAEALMIVAHVIAHADFFRHHRGFQHLPVDMLARAALHRRHMAQFRRQYGDEAVESLIDAAHILADFSGESLSPSGLGERPDDVLGIVAKTAPGLRDWERDVLSLVWEEARYFWPQQVTKVANEGYATFFHTQILRRVDTSAEESWETARLNAQIVQVHPPQLNPYRLGYLLFQEAFHEGGWDAVALARDIYDDAGLVRAYLADELVERAGLALFREREAQPEPRQANPSEIRVRLLRDLDRAGLPRLVVEEAGPEGLVLRHLYDGRDLDLAQLPFALRDVATRVWKGPVTILTMRQRVPHRMTHNGVDWVDQVV